MTLPQPATRRRFDGELIAAGALMGALLAIGIATFRDYGMTTDEFVFDEQAPKFLSWYTSGFRDRSWLDDGDARFYGPWFDIVTAAIQSFKLADPIHVRHAVTFCVGFIGLAALLPMGRLAVGRWAGFIALVLYLTTGYLYGQLFFSPVDVPFMAVMNWSLVAILLMARRTAPSWPMTIVVGLMCGWAMATRVGGIMAEIYLVGAMLLCALAVVSGSEQAPHAVRQIGVRTVAAILIGWLAAFALWPWLQAPNPFARFKAAYDFFSALRTDFQFRHWGREVSSQALPWDYIPSQFLARLSEAFVLLLVIAAGFGIAAAGGFFYKVATRKPGNGPSRFWAGARLIARYRARWIVTAAAFTPVAIAWLTHPTLFDGVRHFLFIVPPLALLAAWALLRMRPRILRYPLAAATIVGIHVGASVARMAALHPFEYTMINAFAAGPAGSSGRFDLDYWSLAATVAVRQLEARLDLDPSDRYRTRAPHVLVCIPWREDKAARLFRRPWIAETDPQQADFLIEPERGWCGQYSGRVVDQVERAGHVFARTIETNRGESEKRLEP